MFGQEHSLHSSDATTLRIFLMTSTNSSFEDDISFSHINAELRGQTFKPQKKVNFHESDTSEKAVKQAW